MKRVGWIIYLSLVFVLNIKGQNASSQCLLTGTVRDSVTARPIAYATVGLYDTAENDVAAAYSLESGSFKILLSQAGTYLCEVSSVGYRPKTLTLHTKSCPSATDLGVVLLSPANERLEEVKVTARRRLVEQKPGMLVYNAENDLTNKGGTAADVLRKAPVLNVDAQGNVTMRGSGNLKILINGKYSGQMARSAADALNMMPADMVKAVEIITTPSAKYDAEGAAGVINIITQKGKTEFSGTLEASVSNLEQMLNPRFSFSKQKWNINFAGHLHRLRRRSEQRIDRTSFSGVSGNNRLQQRIEKDNAAPHGSSDLSVAYTINERNEISLGVTTWVGNWPDGSRLENAVRGAAGNIVEQYLQSIAKSSSYLGTDVNIVYEGRFKKTGQQLTLLAQSSPSRELTKYNATQTAVNEDLLYRELNNSKTKNQEWTLQADYAHPLNKKGSFHLETGAKLIFRNVGTRFNVLASDSQQVDKIIPQPERSDHFKYGQDVAAGYGMLKMNLKNNWYIEGGARTEATYINGKFLHKATGFNSRFLNFVPSATLSKRFDERSTVNISYTKRLTRPYIWDLNPNTDASDPKNMESGNPQLQPEIAHQAEVSYGLNAGQVFFMNAAIFWKQTDNAIIDFIETNAEGISFASKQNLAGNRQFGLNLFAKGNLSAQWTVNGNVNINYFDFSSPALHISRSGWGADINVNSTYSLPGNFSLQAFGDINTTQATLMGTLGRLYYYSLAAKKELKNARLTLTLSAVNLFTKYARQTELITRPNFTSLVDNRFYNRALKATINWEFGGKTQQKERRTIDNSDINVQGKG